MVNKFKRGDKVRCVSLLPSSLEVGREYRVNWCNGGLVEVDGIANLYDAKRFALVQSSEQPRPCPHERVTVRCDACGESVGPTCAVCGHRLDRNAPDRAGMMAKHIAEECPNHPVRSILEENAELRRQRDALLASCQAMLDANYMPGSQMNISVAAQAAIAQCQQEQP